MIPFMSEYDKRSKIIASKEAFNISYGHAMLIIIPS
jgi:hypothetical protein